MSPSREKLLLDRLGRALKSRSGPKGITHCLDAPSPDEPVDSPALEVRGWIAARAPAVIGGLTLINGAAEAHPVDATSRRDVEAHYPGHTVLGFGSVVPLAKFSADEQWQLYYTVDDEPHAFAVPMTISPDLSDVIEEYRALKAQKLATIRPLLRCVECGGSELSELNGALTCLCGAKIGFDDSCYRFPSPAAATGAPVSCHGYDTIARKLIEQSRDQLILDNGAGFRPKYYPNVVNFEIADYPSTDVVGTGEHLPFASESFDAVFSLSVLEHVREPSRCAEEIARVLKPGGTLYAVVPFLQPFHGYPDHYFNMTASGLTSLFDRHLDVQEVGVPVSGLPIWCLSWFLNSYLNGLPEEAADRFRKMRVADLIGEPWDTLDQDFVSSMRESTRRELAASNYLFARKKES